MNLDEDGNALFSVTNNSEDRLVVKVDEYLIKDGVIVANENDVDILAKSNHSCLRAGLTGADKLVYDSEFDSALYYWTTFDE